MSNVFSRFAKMRSSIDRDFVALALCLLTLLGCAFVSGAEPSGANHMEIQTWTNSDALCAEYRFAVSNNGKRLHAADWDAYCAAKIEWDVFQPAGNPKPKKWIRVMQMQSAGSFAANALIHKAMVKEILSRWPVSEFDSIEFIDCLGGAPDWSWNIAIAAASAKSDDYKDFKTNYPNSRMTELFGLYKQLVVETRVYYPLQKLFRESGADIEFESGEKQVLNARADELPFYPRLRAMGINGKTRVIYDALGNAFTIKPCPKNNQH